MFGRSDQSASEVRGNTCLGRYLDLDSRGKRENPVQDETVNRWEPLGFPLSRGEGHS